MNSKSKNTLNVLWFYPDILNLHGGRGDVLALEEQAKLCGLKLEIHRVDRLADEIDFAWADLLLFEPGELSVLPEVKAALLRERGAFEAYLRAGKGLFAIGTSGALFAKKTRRLDGSVFRGLGVFDMRCVERNMPLGDDLIFKVDGLSREVLGTQIQMVDVELASGQKPLGEVVYGYGNGGGNSEKRYEGAISGGAVWTNALGPIFVKNPWFCLWLLKRIAAKDGKTKFPTEKALAPSWKLEIESARAIKVFNEEKKQPCYRS